MNSLPGKLIYTSSLKNDAWKNSQLQKKTARPPVERRQHLRMKQSSAESERLEPQEEVSIEVQSCEKMLGGSKATNAMVDNPKYSPLLQ